jgi:hypothetical protein
MFAGLAGQGIGRHGWRAARNTLVTGTRAGETPNLAAAYTSPVGR